METTRVLLPAPDTPVTAVRVPRGKVTSMSLRLCSLAPRTTSLPLPLRRLSGTSMSVRPDM